MNSFVNYLLESGISLSLFALVYFLFLRRETFFNVNRWFLLVSVGFSAILPILHIPFYAPQATVLPEVTVTPYINLLSSVTIYGTALSHGAEQFVLDYSMLGYVYLLGVVIFAGIFLLRIYQIIRLIAQNRVVSEEKIKLVILDRELSPFSFLNYVFVSKNLHETKGWEKMLEHERQHIHQGHTFDVLMLEIIAIVQWFNPFFWMFRRALRENHEFLADQAVLAHGTAPSWYKQILINQYVGDQIVIANNFNYSLIKTRIKMMSKIKSRKITRVKILIGFVMAASLIAVFACEQKESVKAEKDSNVSSVTLVADGHPLQISGDAAGIDKLKQIITESDDYELKPDSVSGQLKIASKNNKVGEVTVATIGQKQSVDANDPVFFIVEEMPEFLDGELSLRKFIAQSIKYPVSAQEKGIQGKVFVNFVVEKDGSVGSAKIARGVDPALDKEALRVVSSLPKWTPGKQKGVAVRVSYTIPINFVLQ